MDDLVESSGSPRIRRGLPRENNDRHLISRSCASVFRYCHVAFVRKCRNRVWTTAALLTNVKVFRRCGVHPIWLGVLRVFILLPPMVC